MQGRRLPDLNSDNIVPADAKPGDYWKNIREGIWYAYLPKAGVGSLADHDVTEHEDGTITVSPSILADGGEEITHWHGYLEHGIWREV